MKRPIFLNGYYYHIFNRGVEKRDVFLNEKDYRRFLFSTKEFNDINPIFNLYLRMGSRTPHNIAKEPLVDIIHYCLMPNHFHFLLKQIEDNGISRFMQKLGTGYTNYFNLKYERNGVLFQGKFKAVLVDKENYINYLIQYIHLNPLDLIEPNWEEEGLKNWQKAKKFLKSYKWTNCDNYDQYDGVFGGYKVKNFDKIGNLIIE